MAGELQAFDATGNTLYGQVINEATGQIWNTSGTPAFENYATANIANYAITMNEQGSASGFYKGNMPSIPAGIATVVYRRRAGGSPAESDSLVWAQSVPWDGSAVVTLYSKLAPTVAGRTLDVSASGVVSADAVAISSDSTAADNLETMLDGTGGQTLSLGQLNIVASGNNSAIVAWGAGTGHGIHVRSGGGVTGDGIFVTCLSDNGNGFKILGTGSALTITGAPGINVTGATSLNGAVTATNASNDIRGVSLSSTGWNSIVVETGFNPTQCLQVIAAAAAGKSSGGPSSPVYKGLDGSTTRITGAADSNGDRTSATYNV